MLIEKEIGITKCALIISNKYNYLRIWSQMFPPHLFNHKFRGGKYYMYNLIILNVHIMSLNTSKSLQMLYLSRSNITEM